MKYEEIKDKTGNVIKVEEAAGVRRVQSWESCEVAFYIVLLRTRKAPRPPRH